MAGLKKLALSLVLQILFFSISYPFLIDWANKRGDYFSNSGHFKTSITYFKRVLLIAPSNLYALLGCGYSYEDMNQLETAEQYYQKAIEKHPKSGDGYYYMAVLMMRKRQYDKAKGLLEKAVLLPGDYKRDAEIMQHNWHNKET